MNFQNICGKQILFNLYEKAINQFFFRMIPWFSIIHKVDIEFQRKLLVLTEFFNFFDIFTSAGMPKNNNKKLHIFIALVL